MLALLMLMLALALALAILDFRILDDANVSIRRANANPIAGYQLAIKKWPSSLYTNRPRYLAFGYLIVKSFH